MKANLEATPSPKISCAETHDTFNNSVSVQESHLKIYVDSSNMTQGDQDMNIRFRPRDGKCLEQVADGGSKSIVWAGLECNNSSYKDLGQFKLEDQKTGMWVASFQAKTTGQDYTGVNMFSVADDGKKNLVAACLENK